MVRLAENKHYSENKATQSLPLPAKVYLPLIQHLGKICSPEVKVGDTVSLGQKIASITAHVYAPIHASISGKVVAVQDWPHPVLGRAKAVVIEGDGQDNTAAFHLKNQPEIDKLTAQDLRKIVLDAGIVGMGGASFPTHIKLNPPQPVDTLIINGAECEPYLTADARLMVEKTAEISLGIALVARCLGVQKIYIGIEENKPEAIKAFSGVAGIKVKVLPSDYPQGGEKQLIQKILGKEIPRGKLPFDIGVSVQNVATVYAIYEAVYKGKPLIERIVTVAGSCLQSPKNLLVRIGTPIKNLIEFCGPLKEPPAKIIIGGPMMGIAQYTDEVPIIKSSGGLLLMNKKEAKITEEDPCIRCAACVRGCPVGLMPCQINLASERLLWNLTKEYGASDCIECGICNYVCPSNRRLLQTIKRAKLEVVK
ncbi:MAG: electron transport complex subunit RsxC [Candidatus Omnitrophica bacterium]|nr:electron transport complex subunit RsxC [Candidatus Omnitrophota bacterium]MBU4302767.1 electron transport complex subunit RsxC [Candidatus Omnitrophota bacterium]MBU4418782.1 electron transport complex subunit RsxC [Candidatus Omnitrophota bacterium]MBU4467545.1 electron transport complex subunit RsxC [Candidatus Omnitrophota bacterium]MCG2707405.1 electron transport complex subunit RsxC [Candidatus Omnitrophota bacterium]